MFKSAQTAFAAGVKDVSPILLGVFPFGTIAGVTVVSVGIAPLPAMLMSVIVFAGAAQLAMVDLIAKDAPLLVIVVTALVINLRFMMYSASIAPHFTTFGGRWKLLCAYLLTDQAYAVSVIRFTGAPEGGRKLWYFLGCAVPLWLTWQAGTLVGVLLGLQVPRSWSLDFAIPLTFMAILIPAVKDRAAVAAAAAAGLAAVFGYHLPLHTGIIVAALCGIFSGAGVEWVMEKRAGS